MKNGEKRDNDISSLCYFMRTACAFVLKMMCGRRKGKNGSVAHTSWKEGREEMKEKCQLIYDEKEEEDGMKKA